MWYNQITHWNIHNPIKQEKIYPTILFRYAYKGRPQHSIVQFVPDLRHHYYGAWFLTFNFLKITNRHKPHAINCYNYLLEKCFMVIRIELVVQRIDGFQPVSFKHALQLSFRHD